MKSLGLREAKYLPEVMQLGSGGANISTLVSLTLVIQSHHLAIRWAGW